MNNKKILSLVLTALMVFPATVHAKGNDENKKKENNNEIVQFVNKMQKDLNNVKNKDQNNDNNSQDKEQEGNQDGQQKKDENKQAIQQFKTQMQAKHDQMKDIRQQSIAVRQQIEQKKEQLKAIIADLVSGKKTLSQEQLTSLLAASQNLKIDAQQIKATSEIKNEISDAQEKVNKRDFNNALASMDKVIARLQQRLDALKQLNTDMDAALAIANQAVAPAPTTTPDQSNTGTEQTPTTPATTQTTTTPSTTDSTSTQTTTATN